MGHTRLGLLWFLPPGVHIQAGDEHYTRHKGVSVFKERVPSVEGGRKETIILTCRSREDDKEEVDLKDEGNFSWRRMRMMAFQKDRIPGTMAWRHETITSAITI